MHRNTPRETREFPSLLRGLRSPGFAFTIAFVVASSHIKHNTRGRFSVGVVSVSGDSVQ